MDAGEGERDEPRGAEAAPARRDGQPQLSADELQAFLWQARAALLAAAKRRMNRRQRKTERGKARRAPAQSHRRRQQWRTAATATAKLFRPIRAGHQADKERPVFHTEPRVLAAAAAVQEQLQQQAADEITRPIPPAMDDIERGYGDDRSAIMQDFARRLAGARTAGERRAIKDQRKSALAAAREKAKRRKEGRRAAFAAARQNITRKQPPKPRR